MEPMNTKLRSVYADTCVWGEFVAKPSSLKRQLVEKIIGSVGEKRIRLFVSKYVRDEIEEAPKRIRTVLLDILSNVPHKELEESEEALYLARHYVEEIGLTHIDGFHVATAVVNGMDIFLSFNRRTIVNKRVARKLKKMNDSMGYKTPALLTPYGVN